MNQIEKTILERLENLESEIERLKSEKSFADRAIEFERLPAAATVGKDYAAYRFGCSERAVLRGESGTHRIRRVSSKPLKFLKRDVDEAFREHIKTAAVLAAEERATARVRPPRRRSIIKKEAARLIER